MTTQTVLQTKSLGSFLVSRVTPHNFIKSFDTAAIALVGQTQSVLKLAPLGLDVPSILFLTTPEFLGVGFRETVPNILSSASSRGFSACPPRAVLEIAKLVAEQKDIITTDNDQIVIICKPVHYKYTDYAFVVRRIGTSTSVSLKNYYQEWVSPQSYVIVAAK